ncbi:hypothetical protein [Shinella zoogloeoides]|uniref:hypothetical protein n=1 Tax=Shinella zoogloeoides TaxID=352475 RepID=UPI00299DD35E|nr:hypothetical protein [Shinella zoogloeoides]
MQHLLVREFGARRFLIWCFGLGWAAAVLPVDIAAGQFHGQPAGPVPADSTLADRNRDRGSCCAGLISTATVRWTSAAR